MPWETAKFKSTDEPPRTYTREPHYWRTYRFLPWPVCHHCGLVLLKNDFTRWAAAQGCNYKLHPGYAAQYAQSGINPRK